jgi:hypothetical protein
VAALAPWRAEGSATALNKKSQAAAISSCGIHDVHNPATTLGAELHVTWR